MLKLLNAVACLIIFGCKSRSPDSNAVSEHSSKPPYVKIAALNELLNSAQVKKIDDLLTVLKSNSRFSSIFTNAEFIGVSRSVEKSDVKPEFPRIVTFDSNLFLAITTNPKGDYFEDAQIIEYNAEDATYAFASIHSDGERLQLKFNPTECTDCHGPTRMRPIWDSYRLWPSSISGAVDFSPNSDQGPPDRSAALQNFQRYSQNQNPRLQHFSKFINLERSEINAMRTSYPYDTFELSGPLSYTRVMTDMLDLTNFQAITLDIKKHFGNETKKFRFAIAGALAGCSDFNRFFPKKMIETSNLNDGVLQKKFNDEIRESILKEFNRRKKFALMEKTRPLFLSTQLKWISETNLVDLEKIKLEEIDFDSEPRLVQLLQNIRYLTESNIIRSDAPFFLKNYSISRATNSSSYSFQSSGQSRVNRTKVFLDFLRNQLDVQVQAFEMKLTNHEMVLSLDERQKRELSENSEYKDNWYAEEKGYFIPSANCKNWAQLSQNEFL